jgi:hypothetical protein
MVAQDVGGAIRGPGRGDVFWGWGAAAGEQAGRFREPAAMYVLLPRSPQLEVAAAAPVGFAGWAVAGAGRPAAGGAARHVPSTAETCRHLRALEARPPPAAPTGRARVVISRDAPPVVIQPSGADALATAWATTILPPAGGIGGARDLCAPSVPRRR